MTHQRAPEHEALRTGRAAARNAVRGSCGVALLVILIPAAAMATLVAPGEATAAVDQGTPPVADQTGSSAVDPTPAEPAVSAAQEAPAFDAAYGVVPEPADGSYFAILTKMGLGLGLVIALVLVTVWLLRKSALGQRMGGGGGAIRVIERSFLGPKKAIYLVEIGDRTLALGVTDEQVGRLAEWQKGEIDLSAVHAPQAGGSFAAQLRTVLGRDGASGSSDQERAGAGVAS